MPLTSRVRSLLYFAFLIALFLIYGTAMAHSQATIPVSGVKVHDSSMNPLTGRVIFTVTDASDNPISYTPQGGSPTMATFTIQTVNGAVQNSGGFPPTIANPATMTPTGTRYRIAIQNTSGSTVYYTLPLTSVTGSSYSLDGYQVPANVTVTGLGLPNLPCAASAMYNDTTASNPYPWVCSFLSDSGSNYWTQNPSRSPSCPLGNQAVAAPINGGNVFCIPSTTAYATPGFVLGSPAPGAAPGVVALVNAPSGSSIQATTSLLKGTIGGNQGVAATLADVSAVVQGGTNCTDPTKVWSPAAGGCLSASGSPAGSATQVQFAGSSGGFSASSSLTFNVTSNVLAVGPSGLQLGVDAGDNSYSDLSFNANHTAAGRVGIAYQGNGPDKVMYFTVLPGGHYAFGGDSTLTDGCVKLTGSIMGTQSCGSGVIPGGAGAMLTSNGSGGANASAYAALGADGTVYTTTFFANSSTGGASYFQNNAVANGVQRWNIVNFDTSLHFQLMRGDNTGANDWFRIDRTDVVPTQATLFTSLEVSNGAFLQGYHDNTPGYNLGGCVGIGPCGWYSLDGIGSTYISTAQGIKNGMELDDFECLGAGDCNIMGIGGRPIWSGAATRPADEGGTGFRTAFVVGGSDQTGHVATSGGGANATQITLSDTTNGGYGVGRPIIDRTDDVLALTLTSCNTVSGPSTSAQIDSGYVLCTTSASVPVSKQFTLAQNISTPTDKTFQRTSQTFNINTTTQLSVGDLLSIGGMYYETTRITAAGTLSGGVQSITAPLYYSHWSGTIAFANHGGVGMGGRWAEPTLITAANTAGVKNILVVLGSPDATHLAIFSPVTGSMDPLGAVGSAFNIYHGAYITDVRDTTGLVGSQSNGYHFAMMDNDAAWANGASIEVAQEVNQTWKVITGVQSVYNPEARGHFIDLECDNGSYACGNWWPAGNTGLMYFRNANPLSFYTDGGGSAILGRIMHFDGPWGTFAYFNAAPVRPMFEFQNTTNGVQLVQFDDAGGFLNFQKAGTTWNFGGDNFLIQGATGANTLAIVQGDLMAHYSGISALPCTVGAAGGTGTVSCTVTPITRTTGVVTVSTGTAPTTGTLVTITQNIALPFAPAGCKVEARDATTSAVNSSVYTTAPSTTAWSLGLGSSSLAAGTTYTWYFNCF